MKKLILAFFFLCLLSLTVYGATVYNLYGVGTSSFSDVVTTAGTPATSEEIITFTSSTSLTAQCNYGLTSSYGSSVSGGTGTSHTCTISSLSAGTPYHFNITGATSPYPDSTFSTAAYPPALVGEWMFDVGSGSGVDTSGNSYTATLANTSYAIQSVCTTNGVLFNGSTAYVTTTGLLLSSNSAFSITAYVSPSTSSWGNSSYPRIVSTEGASNVGAYEIDIDKASLKLEFGVYNNQEQPFLAMCPNNSIIAGGQYVITGIFDYGGDKKPHLYINGTECNYAAAGGRQDTLTGTFPGTSNTVYWGNRSGSDRAFNGVLDNLRIYNYAIDSTIITANSGECYPPFFAISGLQARTTSSPPQGLCRWAGNAVGQGGLVAYGAYNVYLTFEDNANTTSTCTADSKTHGIWVQKFDYSTGLWTQTATSIATVNSAYARHDSPSVFRNTNLSAGKVVVVYGAVVAGNHFGASAANGPFYNVSTNDDDITSWATQGRVPDLGGFSEIVGGFTLDGAIHLFGQQQWDAAATNPSSSAHDGFSLKYAHGTISGSTITWDTNVYQLICDPFAYSSGNNHCTGGSGNYNATSVGPGCMRDVYILPGTNYIYIIWSSTTDGCTAIGKNLNFIKSLDGGANWTNVAGNNSFTRLAGLVSTTSYGNYPNYQIEASTVDTNAMVVRALSNGNPVVINKHNGGALIFFQWNGSSWNTQTVDANAGTNNSSIGMEVLSDTHIVIFNMQSRTTLYRYDGNYAAGAWTWTKGSSLFTASVSADGFNTRLRTPTNQATRIYLEWFDNITSATPNYENVRFWDMVQ